MVFPLLCAPNLVASKNMSLPAQIDPYKLALQGILLEGQVAVNDLPRLSSSVMAVSGSLKASIQFELDESRQRIARGKASVCVDVVCQRCLDAVNIELKADFALQLIYSEDQIANVAANYEPWVVVDRMADLNSVIEDEVLLVLPIVNYHRAEDCTGDTFVEKVAAKGEEAVVDSPFNVLKQLKQQ